jgi:hypothetical protein
LPQKPTDTRKRSHADERTAARRALLQIFEPTAQFGLDLGLSVRELTSILREAAVRSVAVQQLEGSHRINMSGIAATTGIPRGEISRILKPRPTSRKLDSDRHQQATNRVLAAWSQGQRFTTSTGQPAVLKIYGRGATFETLVKKHGRGIPIRAMLDELARRRAVEVRSSRLIRFKAMFAVDRKLSSRTIENFGNRGSKLLSVMLNGMRHPENSVTIDLGSRISADTIPRFRKDASGVGLKLLANIKSMLMMTEKGKILLSSSSLENQVVATIIIHRVSAKYKKPVLITRRNLQRGI